MTYPAPDLNIRDLPGRIAIKIRDTLNQASEHRNWRKLLEVAGNDYPYRLDQVAHFSNFVLNTSSGGPASEVFNDLGTRGCTVQQLTSYLNTLRLEKLVLQLKRKEPIRILTQPECSITILEGECLKITVSATGLPYPRYLWYHCNDKNELVRLEDQTDAALKITKVRFHHSGHYCCQLHNGNPDEVTQSEYCEVLVKPNPNAVFEEDNPPQAFCIPDNSACNNNVLYNRVNNINVDPQNAIGSAHAVLQPVIMFQPSDVLKEDNSNVKFSVVVQGQGPLEYRWYKDERLIKKSLENVLEINKLTLDDVGVYKCSVHNAYGMATTSPFTLQIIIYQQAAPSDREHRITLQPQSITVTYGGVAKFRCEVEGGRNHDYQWYKDGNPLPGANEKQYEIKICDSMEKYSGDYYCRINTSCGELMSARATLKIEKPPAPQYRATDKVALLIGNADYKSAKKLNATESDIQKLTDVLKKLKFKVVSLLNLTLTEMESAIDEFCHLLGNGVYGFFYFCGHGFEEYSRQYMVPYDAPTGFIERDCLCLTNVVTKISRTDPALICVVLDMCRARNNRPGDIPVRDGEVDERHIKPNQAFLFATTYGLEAFETPTEGLLIRVLPEEILKEQSIDQAFSNVKKAFSTMSILKNSGKCQYPDTRGNLNEERCLTDPICADGYTQEFNIRSMRWAELCMKPRRHRMPLQDGIVIELDFQDAASNVLIVFISLKQDETQTKDCNAYICDVPTNVYQDDSRIIVEGKRQTTIRDIQRLKDNLIITIRVDYKKIIGLNCLEQSITFGCDLGLPLWAKLKLYESRTGKRHATESDETINGGQRS